MHSASNTRQFATEGQLFRAHLNPTSVLDALYNARPGELTRSCAYSSIATFPCPAIQKRLWADGGFPPKCSASRDYIALANEVVSRLHTPTPTARVKPEVAKVIAETLTAEAPEEVASA